MALNDQDPDTPAQDEFDLSLLDAWSDWVPYSVTRESIAAYAAATNDRNALHLSGDQAPIVYAVVPAFSLLAERVLAPTPEHLMMRILHGEHQIDSSRPIIAGDHLRSRSKLLGIHGKSSGVVVATLTETIDANDAPVCQQYFAGFFRGGRWDGAAGQPFPEHALPDNLGEPAWVDEQSIDADQTHRYAAASGDPMPIHTDPEFAKMMGLPGIIAHGLCVMAMASSAVVEHECPNEPARLRSLAVRFAKPSFPKDVLTTSAWRLTPDANTVGFTTAVGDITVLADGLAQLAPAGQ